MKSLRVSIVGVLFLALSVGLIGMSGSTSHADVENLPGFDLGNLDKSCKPCEDFNQFANGGWITKNEIPAAYPSWGRFNVLAERNREAVHKILEEAKDAKAPKGSNEQKIGDFYCSCMDEKGVEDEGIKPLQSELARIKEIKDISGLVAVVGRFHTYGINAMFNVGSTQDYKNSTQVIAEINQAGLSLPDRDYYTKDDDKSKQIREEYLKHVAKMFELMGEDSTNAANAAKVVMAIETKLAQASMTRVERRDPNATYNKMAIAQLSELAPSFPWGEYFKVIGMPPVAELNVSQPNFFKAVNQELTAVSIADWQTYLKWHLLRSSSNALPAKFVDESFHFNGTILTGTKENLPRWKRCTRLTDGMLGEALGEIYVKKNFSPAAKARALEMVKNIQAALRDDIQTLSWMGTDTRKEALRKLDAIVNKIGYPDKWRDYAGLEIERNSLVTNILKATQHEFKRDLAKINRPLDRGEWGMTPPTVNAYYNPLLNEIAFPAGILQPPFFDPAADDAINYGGIGAVIGHELTHGFDDQGRQFDYSGNLKEWWTENDLKNFKERATCVEQQFDSYEVEPGVKLNGKLVVGESIADLGGLTIAFAAYQKSLQGKPQPKDLAGFTPEQRFFLGYAQIWASNARPEYKRLLVSTDPHPLARFRVNGPLSNMTNFAKAFGCKSGDAMIRTQQCQIW